MNVLYGLARPDEGAILLDGKPVQIAGPSDAIARGISMVHQHFMLIPVLSVAENVILGAETMANAVFVDRAEASRRIGALAEQFGFNLDPDARVSHALGRPAAAGRDPQGALPRRPDPHPRRADGGPDAAGDRRDLRPAAPARRGRPLDHLHQPQALRGPGGRRPDHRHQARQGDRRAETERDDRGGAGRADGRPRGGADRGPGHVASGRADAARRGPAGRRRPRATRPCPGSHSRSGPARSSALPAWPATARTSWSRRSSDCASQSAAG